jgi:outer membrane protein TolC
MTDQIGRRGLPPGVRLAIALAACSIVSACSLAPAYEVPAVPLAGQYREIGPWVTAQPADRLSRDGWWKMYDEPQLDELERQLLANNSDLAAAYSHFMQAQAFVEQVSSGNA